MNNQNYSIEDPDKLMEYINDNISPNEKDKKLHGEVFTPIELVKEMLDKLPSDVWSNPKLIWLDPAVGIGNFPIIAYLNLMNGLKEWEQNEEKRRKHILENMLYMVEINKKNIIILKKILCDDKYKLNIFEGSFFDIDEYNPTIKFDIIIGNPPYQDINIYGNVKHGSGKLYPNFILKSLTLLNKNAYLLFITPNTWFSGAKSKTGNILEILKKKNVILINSRSTNKNYFKGVGTGNLVYYLIQNTNNYTDTLCISTNTFKFKITDYDFIPNILEKYSLSILKKTLFGNFNKFQIVKDSGEFHEKYCGSISKTTRSDKKWVVKDNLKTIEHKYSIYHTNKQTLYSSVDNFFRKRNKILISQSSSWKPIYDDGKLGFTQNVLAILVNNHKEGKYIINIFNSKLYQFLIKCIRYSVNITIYYFNYFPYPYGLPNNPTDQDIYNYYGITKQEQQLIEEVVKKI